MTVIIMMNSSFSKLFTLLTLMLVEQAMAHDCDNAAKLPTGDGIIDVFGLDRLEDASHFKHVWDSSIPIISNPQYSDSDMEYTHASTSSLYVLDNKPNPYGWCWQACAPYESDDTEINPTPLEDYVYGSFDTYEGCWTECESNSTFYYGLSYFHRLAHDETWHFYFGDVLYLYELDNNAEGDIKVTKLGADTYNGEVWQHTVKAGTWFGTQVNPDSLSANPYTFGSTMYSPIFEYGDYELGDMFANYTWWDTEYPNAKDKIVELSYFPDYVPPTDDPYAETGLHSLCRSDSHDGGWHQYSLYEELTLDEVITHYDMDVAPKSGYYKMIYEAEDESLTNYGGIRSAQSSMYYAMNDTVFFHKQNSDETYHFYNGEPIIMYVIDDSSRPRVLRAVPIGNNMDIGEIPHYTIPRDTWIAFEFANNNYTYWNHTNSTPYALLGLTNAPGYDIQDLEYGVPQAMIENFPEFATTIASLYATGTAQGSSEIVYVNPIGGGSDGIGGYDADGNLLTSQKSAFNDEAKPITKGGKAFLYIMVCLCFLGVVALIVKTSRRSSTEGGRQLKKQQLEKDQEDQYSFAPPQSVTLVCERGGVIQDTEVLSLPSTNTRGSSEA